MPKGRFIGHSRNPGFSWQDERATQQMHIYLMLPTEPEDIVRLGIVPIMKSPDAKD
jgi:hypothetical protein